MKKQHTQNKVVAVSQPVYLTFYLSVYLFIL